MEPLLPPRPLRVLPSSPASVSLFYLVTRAMVHVRRARQGTAPDLIPNVLDKRVSACTFSSGGLAGGCQRAVKFDLLPKLSCLSLWRSTARVEGPQAVCLQYGCAASFLYPFSQAGVNVRRFRVVGGSLPVLCCLWFVSLFRFAWLFPGVP